MHFPFRNQRRRRGSALVMVLAFVVLLTGLVIAYFFRTTSERQLSQGSFNQYRADQLAVGACAIVVGDLRQEIVNGSSASTVGDTTIYTPTSNANVIPQRSGTEQPSSGVNDVNMVRRSLRADPIPFPGVASRASASNSYYLSYNGRRVTTTRWNKHCLLLRSGAPYNAPGLDMTKYSPDWVYTNESGPVVVANASAPVLGRYSYYIFDEGGLADVNVAGYPSTAVRQQIAPQGTPVWMSFPQLGPNSGSTIPSAQVDAFIGWRNYATIQPNGAFGSYTIDASASTRYFSQFNSTTCDFLRTTAVSFNGSTDQAVANRQQLLALQKSIGFTPDGLHNMGTFTREQSIPSWGPTLGLRVEANFVRRNGTTAKVGEPLLQRFPLGHSAWLSSTGPVLPGTIATIRRDFGLVWVTDHWEYQGLTGHVALGAIAPITGDHEPDFFQLIALAKPAASIAEVLSIGASLIDQSDADSVTTSIDYAGPPTSPPDPPSAHLKAWGVEKPTTPVPTGAPAPPIGVLALNRPLRSVGELGYVYKNSNTPLDFVTTGEDAAILDLFSMTEASIRAGGFNLNTRNPNVFRAAFTAAMRVYSNGSISPLAATDGDLLSKKIRAETSATPALSRQDLARLAQKGVVGGSLLSDEEKKVVARTLADMGQTRTWNLLIDLIAQPGRFRPNSVSTNLDANFIVDGERHYWMHISIDRFTGQTLGQQMELVIE